VTGDVTLFPVILFMIIFIWTPPHFWALSLLIKDEYKNAQVPMLPVTSGVAITKTQIMVYTLVMAVVALTPYFAGFSGDLYFYVALVLNAVFIYLAARIQTDKTKKSAKQTFLFSIFYLFALFLTLVVDHAL
jgi:protoheme IX farnesyltransferase